ncbi:protein phosphatase [Fulvimonas soli]|jgi:protein phosphatase|uniref:Protein phosphatase n=2 Tax=Fulvimonas soli TaxID=155197 RepID=A0A316II00_9GAMM|nr:protein phosphatase [Fulvimonas soli]
MLRFQKPPAAMIEFGHGTHVGLRRARNEDTYYADAALGLFLVADGMGGHQHGEVAAAIARDTMAERVAQGHALAEAVREANQRLLEENRDCVALPMGTTLVALRLLGEAYEAVWVGDSRAYRWRRELRRISHDHSLVEELVASGRLDPAQAARHPQRNVLTQALGVTRQEQLHIGMARGRIEPGAGFLLCSDGLNESLDDEAIARVLARGELAAQECVDHLLLAALEGSASDNITAVLVRIS